MARAEALEGIRSCSGTQFNPLLVDELVRLESKPDEDPPSGLRGTP
jgi:hypothetical protein